MNRRHIRENAVRLIYEIDIRHEKPDGILKRFFDVHLLKPDDIAYINSMVRKVFEHKAEIDAYIEKSLENRDITCLAKMDLAVLRLAIAEILYTDDVPPRVAINEAVELAKRYGGQASPAFVNGVLAGFFRKFVVDKVH